MEDWGLSKKIHITFIEKMQQLTLLKCLRLYLSENEAIYYFNFSHKMTVY